MSELKSCPFCDASQIIDHCTGQVAGMRYVVCGLCGARSTSIKNWNTRAPAPTEQYSCVSCVKYHIGERHCILSANHCIRRAEDYYSKKDGI